MIKLENTLVNGWEPAIRGMRNPMNSWEKSDSQCLDDVVVRMDDEYKWYYKYCIGPNDQKLMLQLAKAGTEHSKFRRMIVTYVDITAPLYWWKEFDTYKVGTVANSCSTMHKIHAKEFELEDFSCEHLTPHAMEQLEGTISMMNENREWYLKYDHMADKDKENFNPAITNKKDIWWQLIQLLPSSYNQKRTVMMNYENLAAMYRERKDHKLDEWHDFCDWIKTLPFSEVITLEEEGD